MRFKSNRAFLDRLTEPMKGLFILAKLVAKLLAASCRDNACLTCFGHKSQIEYDPICVVPPKTAKTAKASKGVKIGQCYLRKVRSGQVRSGQVRSGQIRSGQVRSGQVR